MRHILRALVAVPAVALAAGCVDRDRSAGLPVDLQQDLDLAKSTSLELASGARADGQVTSALEQVPAGAVAPSATAPVATPRRERPPAVTQVARRSPRTAPAPVPLAEAAEEAAEGEALPAEAEVAVGEEEAPAPAEAEPEVLAGPQITPEGIGSGRPRDPGGFGGLDGSGGGAVVRGGGRVGVDDCPRFPGGPIIAIGRRLPPGGPIYGRPVTGGIGAGDLGGRARAGGGIRSRGAGRAIPVMSGAPRSTAGGATAAGPRRRQ